VLPNSISFTASEIGDLSQFELDIDSSGANIEFDGHLYLQESEVYFMRS